MGTLQFPAEGTAAPYGTTQRQTFRIVSLTPIQIIGLIPCRPQTDDCKGDVCYRIKVVDGDRNSFLFEFATDDNSGVLIDDYRLEKQNASGAFEDVVTGNPNNTLGSESGTKFTFGSFPEYPTYSGYQVDWNKVYDFFGAGIYRFKVFNPYDTNSPSISLEFMLMENTCDNTDSTVYIELNSVGKFRNWRFTNTNDRRMFDLRNMNWVDSCRYSARFDPVDVEPEETFTLFADKKNKLNGTETKQNYNLRLFDTTYELFKRLFQYGLVSNDINITDGNKDSLYNFNNIKVVRKSDNDFTQYVNNRIMYNVNIALRGEFDEGFSQC